MEPPSPPPHHYHDANRASHNRNPHPYYADAVTSHHHHRRPSPSYHPSMSAEGSSPPLEPNVDNHMNYARQHHPQPLSHTQYHHLPYVPPPPPVKRSKISDMASFPMMPYPPAPVMLYPHPMNAPSALPHFPTSQPDSQSAQTKNSGSICSIDNSTDKSAAAKKSCTPSKAAINKGLRHFSMKVCERVQKRGTTSYNEVADDVSC